ncbi:MAG: histidine--tRNA ligase [Solirubrobacterales bacterium]
MAGRAQAPRGTFDVLPADAPARAELERVAARRFADAGFGRIETPVFEDTGLFGRAVGESTDVVSKEMYTFSDQGDRSLTLRPEGTAAVCRAYVEHGMHKLPQPVKLWYSGPFFRQEAPQAGRFRQFTQIGSEAFGSDDPALDAESITLLARLLDEAGVAGYRLRISSLGSHAERSAYGDQLKDFLRANESALSDEVRDRIEQNPLRAFDAKHGPTQAVMAEAPRLLGQIGADDRRHFDDVLALLGEAGVAFEVDDTLVRGLDYYTRTVFEFTSDRLGAQSGVGGGGRYDGLVEMLGGPPTPGIGWAAGIERVLAAGTLAGETYRDRLDVYVALDTGADRAAAFRLATTLRDRGVSATMELAGRSIKGQLKQADRLGAPHVVILGGGRGAYDAAIKRMQARDQIELTGLTKETYVEKIIEEIST